jgi:uncharacterized protein YigE (DUF2233 family)
MRIHQLSFILLIGAGALSARADWRTSSIEEGATPLGRHFRVIAKESDSNERAELHLAIFDARKTSLRVIDQPDDRRTDLANVMSRENCLAGVNGGYFDPQYKPVGLLISGGRTVAPFRRAKLLSGVLSVADGRVRLQRVAEFSLKAKMSEARQCGPFLVDHARAVAGLDDSASARRTFVAIGSENAIVLGHCSSLSLAQLSHVLSSGKMANELKIERALNLDGGSSSAFWFGDGDKPVSIPEQKTVRDFLGICEVPRRKQ